MLEMLILTTCIKGSLAACENAGAAYYKQSGLEHAVSEQGKFYSERNPVLAQVIAYTAVVAQGSMILNMGHGKILTINGKSTIIGFRSEF